MLQKTINAYPFKEYRDDDNIRSFFDMFNVASQQYLDWFNTAGLPYYPGLSGSLLQWVGNGLYGQPYYNALESPGTPALGPLNTADLNTIPLDFYSFPTETVYQVTDDIYKRIITWNFFKGDGTRFCPRWLKRRIMRFIVGVSGIDPQPANSGFVVGCENTTAISVQFSGSTCTIAINQLALSAMLQLTPDILNIFAAAFLAPGLLEKPIEWTYVVDIETTAHALVSPLSLSVTGAAAAESTGGATVSVLGGSGSYTYAWTWLSGGAGITINAPTANVTNFSATALAPGQTFSGIAQCVVTDTVSHLTTSCAVPVSLIRVSLPVATPTPPTIVASGASANVTSGQEQAIGSGGGSPYSFVWVWQSGGAGIGIDSPNTGGTTFTGIGIPALTTLSGVALCTMTDSYGQVTTCTVPVEITRASAVVAGIAPASLSVTGGSSSETTGNTTVTATGGIPPYTYSWGIQSGAGIVINSPTAATTSFTGTGIAPNTTLSGVAQCTVKDTVGQSAVVTCALTFVRESALTASVLPVAQNSVGEATTQTTAISTVTPAGGSGTYTYSWVWASGGAGIAINAPSSAATNFTAGGMTPNTTLSGIAQCTVTDAFGLTAQVTVSVSIQCLPPQVSPTVLPDNSQSGPDPGGSLTVGYFDVGGSLLGSISNATIPGGLFIQAIDENYALADSGPVYAGTLMSISGFGSDPGKLWLLGLSSGAKTLTGVAAHGYTYSAGVAIWSWSTGPLGFQQLVPQIVTISHTP